MAESVTEAAVRWRVATIGQGDAEWVVRRPAFENEMLAEEWAHYLLWPPGPACARARNVA
jgi:hypothetical protein